MPEIDALRDRIAKKRKIGQQQVSRLIRQKEKATLFPRGLATLAVAHENGISIAGYATPEELGQLRESQRLSQPPPQRAEPTRPPKRQTARPTPNAKQRGKESRRRERPKDTRARRVVVVHGRDEELRRDLFRFLRALDLLPLEWVKAIQATGRGAPSITQIVDKLFADATAVVVLMTPDDQVTLSPRLRKATDPPYESEIVGQARPNVFYEAGLAMARFPNSTIIVQVGKVKVPSDFDVHITRLTNSRESRQELVAKLRAAGCDLDTDGTEWLSEGNFEREEEHAGT